MYGKYLGKQYAQVKEKILFIHIKHWNIYPMLN